MALGVPPRPGNTLYTGTRKVTIVTYHGILSPTLGKYDKPAVQMPTAFLSQKWKKTLQPRIRN